MGSPFSITDPDLAQGILHAVMEAVTAQYPKVVAEIVPQELQDESTGTIHGYQWSLYADLPDSTGLVLDALPEQLYLHLSNPSWDEDRDADSLPYEDPGLDPVAWVLGALASVGT